jgi:integrase
MPISDATIRVATVPSGQSYTKLFDGHGLYLLVKPNGAKLWMYKYRYSGKERTLSVGPYKDAEHPNGKTLAEARKARTAARGLLDKGKDPTAERRDDRAAEERKREADALKDPQTFEAYATAYHGQIAGGFRNPKHRQQWLSSLKLVFKAVGRRDLGDIRQSDLITALRPIMRATPETGRRVRQRITEIFAAALDDKLITTSPASGLTSKLTRKRTGEPKRDKNKHFRALPFRDVPAFYAKLRDYENALRLDPTQSLSAVLALRLALLCASRSGEVRHATRDEFSADNEVWTIPPSRMKAKVEHTVHLSEPAQAIIREQRERTKGRGFVFPASRKKGALSDMAMSQIVRRLPTGDSDADGEPITYRAIATVHGFRAGFSSWCEEKNVARAEVREACLAHKIGSDVARAYTHQARFDEERRALMTAWANYVTEPSRAKVVDIGTRRKAAGKTMGK